MILYIVNCSLHLGHVLQLPEPEILVSEFTDVILMLNTVHLSRSYNLNMWMSISMVVLIRTQYIVTCVYKIPGIYLKDSVAFLC